MGVCDGGDCVSLGVGLALLVEDGVRDGSPGLGVGGGG